jgi:xylulokinase
MSSNGHLLGFDIGSSSVKATLLDSETQKVIASATSPADTELAIDSPQPGFAEQDPETWWSHVKAAAAMLKKKAPSSGLKDVRAVGISYQMHGLVMVDKNKKPLAPANIWCDSRAVEIGNKALLDIGKEKCLKHLYNSPGNFTASKFAWVKKNRPDIFKQVHKIMLPGDYIAMKLTGAITTTATGLSEGIMWDFVADKRADFVLDYFGFDHSVIPEITAVFSKQGSVLADVAAELGLTPGIPVSYRAGDQPNNALSLNVLNPGEVAATAGTSGVVYGVTDTVLSDAGFRVNTFAHVNHTAKTPRYGILLCVNGTGILNRWMKQNMGASLSYDQMNTEAMAAAPGCNGLRILPFGNGAERSLGNRNIHASVHGLDLTVHTRQHMLRAAQEGIVFALRYGLDIMGEMGCVVKKVRAGDANMFKSALFSQVFSTLTGAQVDLYNTDGAQGAARAAGIGAGIYASAEEAFKNLATVRSIEPDRKTAGIYKEVYGQWKELLQSSLH